MKKNNSTTQLLNHKLYVGNPFQSPNVLSFCPGFLGLERGLIRAIGEINVVAYVEIEAFIVANLIAGMEAGRLGAAPVWTDAKTFHQVAEKFRNKVHIITGGYPCQPFSTAGKRKGAEDPRHLWPYLFRNVQTIRPVCCFFENVGGHLSMGYDQVYKDLRSIGYTVEAGLFTAEEVGAPHERERLFILAIDQQWMEHTNSNIHPGRLGNGGNSKSSGQDKGEEDQWKRVWNESGTTGSQLAHTNSSGQTKQRHHGEQECTDNDRTGHAGTEISNTCSTDVQRAIGLQTSAGIIQFTDSSDQWPARPGEQQHDWEEKRTVEPGVGSTINGYNFREDLLRALGNSVVEQTAELAFITLLQKHIKNIEIVNNEVRKM